LRKLKILVVTLVMTLLMASPSYAVAIVANIGGSVCIDCDTDITRTSEEDNDTDNSTFEGNVIISDGL
jgi:hypothetical protein